MPKHENAQMNIDVFSEEFNKNPYPTYSHLRKTDPIYRTLMPSGQYVWMVTRYDDAVAVLKDQRFIKDITKLTDEDVSQDIMMKTMLFSDPPDHKRLRGLVQQAFTPRMIEGLRGRIEDITNELIDGIQEKNEMNFIDEFAFPLPIIVICEMLGVPTEDRDKFREWSNILVENQESFEDTQESIEAFTSYVQDFIAKRRRDPQEDLVSKLIQAEENGEPITEQEVAALVFLLIIAGHETTVNLIGNGVLALLKHPEQKAKLQRNPDLIHAAVEECLRYDGPVEFSTERWAGENAEINGKTIPKGDLVLVVIDSADRDPEQFDNPDVFDITREKSRHIAFGKGIHFCLGAPLARLEAEIAISTLLRRLPDLRLNTDPETLEYRPGMLIRGLKELPVAY